MRSLRISVAGGSIGGLTTAVLLHEAGHDVHVYERSTRALEARGAGIVVLPMTERYFVEKGTSLGESGTHDPEVALTLTNWNYIDRAGTITHKAVTNNRFTSWNTLYRALLAALPPERYHLSSPVTGVELTEVGVAVHIDDRPDHDAELLIGADGVASTVREFVAPETTTDYAGYVAWRGTVLESELPVETRAIFEDAMVYQVLPYSHILIYAIPGARDSIVVGERALNWVWYRNAPEPQFAELMTDRNGEYRPTTMPPGLLRDRFVDELHTTATELLSPQFADVVCSCEDTFIQAIFDMTADRFVRGRAALIGDAASALRPHVAAGTAKACADGWALADHLDRAEDLDRALSSWEVQQRTLAIEVAEKSAGMGRRSLVENRMVSGDDEWRFGLFGPGT
ncbi:MAG: FAD-dependent monooxygenase [Acidimicrobiales bacterium]